MVTFLVTLQAMGKLVKQLVFIAKKPEARALLVVMAGILIGGMVFYRLTEGWSWLDCLYFCVITLSTVGYGDMSPTMPATKMFTIVYIILGLSMFAPFLNLIVQARKEMYDQSVAAKLQQESDPKPTAS